MRTVKTSKPETIPCNVNWSEPAWSTLQNFGIVGAPPGPDRRIMSVFAGLLNYQHQERHFKTIYVNPAFVVVAPTPTRQFIRQARQAQQGWLGQCRKVLFPGGGLTRAIKRTDPLLRQLAYLGVLIVNGKHVNPQQWPEGEEILPPAPLDLTDQVFGRLTVEAMLPKGRCSCRCRCGGRRNPSAKNLLRGKTRSCGCLPIERTNRQRARKRNRAWLHTGELQ